MSRFTAMTIALIAIGALVAPAGAASKGPAAGKTVHVGVIADVTGAAGVYGTPQKNAYDLANDDIKSGALDAGGANLSFDVADAATDPAQVVNLMQKFTTDPQTSMVLGPTLSGEAFKAFPLAVRAGFPAMGTSTTAEGVTAIGPTTAPTRNATDTAAAQAGHLNTRRAEDHDHIRRVIAHLLVTVRALEPAATVRRRA